MRSTPTATHTDHRWQAIIDEYPDIERLERCVMPFNTESIGFALNNAPPMPPIGRNEVATLSALAQARGELRFDAIVLPPIVRGWRIEALVIMSRSLELDAPPLVDRMIKGPAGESVVINLHGKLGQRYDLIARNVNAGDYDCPPTMDAAERKGHFRGVFWCRR